MGLFAIHITFAGGPDSSEGKMGMNREDGKGGKIEALMCFQLVGFFFFVFLVDVLFSLTLMPHFTCSLPQAIGQRGCAPRETMNKKLQ